jgi:hypothetical protein
MSGRTHLSVCNESVVRKQHGMNQLGHGLPHLFYICALVPKLDRCRASSGSMCDSLHA